MASHHPACEKDTERAGWAGCKAYLPATSPTACARSVQPVNVPVNSMLRLAREKISTKMPTGKGCASRFLVQTVLPSMTSPQIRRGAY